MEAKPGDRLLPEEVDIPLNFFPRSPSSAIDGRIISVVGGVTQIGQYMVVVLNRGSNNGLSVGDVLTVFQTGEEVKDRFGGGTVRLPEEEAGTVMIFKTYDRISYGLVMEATQAIHIHDTVRNPTLKLLSFAINTARRLCADAVLFCDATRPPPLADTRSRAPASFPTCRHCSSCSVRQRPSSTSRAAGLPRRGCQTRNAPPSHRRTNGPSQKACPGSTTPGTISLPGARTATPR